MVGGVTRGRGRVREEGGKGQGLFISPTKRNCVQNAIADPLVMHFWMLC